MMIQLKASSISRAAKRRFLIAVSVIVGLLAVSSIKHAAFQEIIRRDHRLRKGVPIDGSLPVGHIIDFRIDYGIGEQDIPEFYWIWVQKVMPSAPRFCSVTGIVEKSQVTDLDFPFVHDSHDMNIDVRVDPGQEYLLSDVDKPNDSKHVSDAGELKNPTTLELEWETGTFPNETGKNAPERFFPKWAWPSVGDRVWANGHWIFDVGHPKRVGEVPHYRTELHPLRAIASMRKQVEWMLFSNGEWHLVPVTATDLYIHGRGGYIVDVLNCGPRLILSSNPNSCPTKTTPIDENFEFDIPAPPRPNARARLITRVAGGPGNTISIKPILEPRPKENPSSVHVTIPLAGSEVKPTATYARRIYVGWESSRIPALYHLRVTLKKMDLHDQKDQDPGDGECSFFWMNVNRAPNEWIRLVDYARGNMNDYDDDHGFGDGEMDFSGASFTFSLPEGESFTVRANGYEQDCIDDYFGGDHSFNKGKAGLASCFSTGGTFGLNYGNNDPYKPLAVKINPRQYFTPERMKPGSTVYLDITSGQSATRPRKSGGEYELEFTMELLEKEKPPEKVIIKSQKGRIDGIRRVSGVTQISHPKSVALGATESNTRIWVFMEKQSFSLPRNISVNITKQATYNSSNFNVLTTSIIPAGTVVNSYFLHFDPTKTPQQEVIHSGSIVFQNDILGVIVFTNELDNSDVLGLKNTTYPTRKIRARGLEGKDMVTLRGKTLSLNLAATSGVDQIRVITKPDK